jgi:hypothetical protein
MGGAGVVPIHAPFLEHFPEGVKSILADPSRKLKTLRCGTD